MIDDYFGWIVAVVIAVIVGLVVWICVIDAQHWEKFSVEHHCVKVGKISDSVGVGVGVSSDGKNIVPTAVYVPGKTGWKCDDGVTYWR